MTAAKGPDPLSGYLPGFDGLRACAVLLVMAGHAASYRAIVPGGLGVTIFFTISGFLITTLLLNEIKRSSSVDLPKFYIRRFLRLYPELLLFVTIMLIAGWFFGWQASLSEKVSAVFYFFNYQYLIGDRVPLELAYPWAHLWSLAVEEHFYFIFPILVVWTSKSRTSLLLVVGVLIAGPLLWRLMAWYALNFPSNYLYEATDSRIDSIAWGCLLAVLMRLQLDSGMALNRFRFIGRGWFAIGVALLLISLLIRDPGFQNTFRYSLQGFGLFLAVANCLFDPRWTVLVRFLELSPMKYLGRISYGLYLFHLPIFTILAKNTDERAIWFLPLASALSIAVAACSYRLVDDPIKPLRRRFGSHAR